jgi:hypothetical protein
MLRPFLITEIQLLKHQIYQLQQDALACSGSDPSTGSGQSSSAEGSTAGNKKGKKRSSDEGMVPYAP